MDWPQIVRKRPIHRNKKLKWKIANCVNAICWPVRTTRTNRWRLDWMENCPPKAKKHGRCWCTVTMTTAHHVTLFFDTIDASCVQRWRWWSTRSFLLRPELISNGWKAAGAFPSQKLRGLCVECDLTTASGCMDGPLNLKLLIQLPCGRYFPRCQFSSKVSLLLHLNFRRVFRFRHVTQAPRT